MQGTVFILARLKIVHSYHQELVLHAMNAIAYIEANLVYSLSVGRVCFQCSYLQTSNLGPFSSSLTNLTTSLGCFPRQLYISIREDYT